MDDSRFEFDAPSTFANLYEMANSNDDGADKFFDIITEQRESAKSEPNLEIVKKVPVIRSIEDEENKENFAPTDDQFDDQNISSLAHQLIRSARKSRSSKLQNRHSITVEGIELELPRIKHHAMITRLDQLEYTPKIDLRTRTVVKSEYRYEHVQSGSLENVILDKSSNKFMSIAEKVRNYFNNTPPRFRTKPTIPPGSKVFKSRTLFSSASDLSVLPNDPKNIVNKQTKIESDSIQQNNQHLNSNIPHSAIKSAKSQKIKVLNSHGGVQVVESKELGHSGIRVQEKQLHTIPKPFSFESRKSCAVKPQNLKSAEQPWMFKARPATVLKKKPFVPKHEKKFTEPKNVHLNTERRAQEWMVFEQEMKEKFAHYEEIYKKKQEEKTKKEMDFMKSLRQQTVHKPIPIKKYKPVLIRKSERPVTIPQSPRFSIRPVKSRLNSVCE